MTTTFDLDLTPLKEEPTANFTLDDVAYTVPVLLMWENIADVSPDIDKGTDEYLTALSVIYSETFNKSNEDLPPVTLNNSQTNVIQVAIATFVSNLFKKK